MKKKIDVSQVASTLRGESVFFPLKDEQPDPGRAGEPLENSAIELKHQVTKAPQVQSTKTPSNQIIEDTKHESTKAQENQSTTAESNHTAIAQQVQSTKALKHFSSYLQPETYKAWKLLATQRERKDYEILQEAVEQYVEREQTKA